LSIGNIVAFLAIHYLQKQACGAEAFRAKASAEKKPFEILFPQNGAGHGTANSEFCFFPTFRNRIPFKLPARPKK
jgi:hypothetical protein